MGTNRVLVLMAASVCLAGALLIGAPRAASAADDQPDDVEAAWASKEAKVTAEYKAHEEKELAEWEEKKKSILKKWPTADMPEQKKYVEYSDNDSARVKIDYENGKVVIEALEDPSSGDAAAAKSDIKKAINSAMKASKDDVFPPLDLMQITDDASDNPVLGIVDRAVAAGMLKGTDGKQRAVYRVTFDLVPNHIKLRAAKLKPIVEEFAKKYGLNSALVYGIIRQESTFNPRARSPIPAFGLMQIVPKYAGLEVLRAVSGKSIQPDAEYLYDPKNNVMVGATYLQLLRDQYFPDVKDEVKRTYFMICSYNWGPHRIQAALKRGKISVKMTREDLFKRLQEIAPAETSEYLRKVSKYSAEFQQL